MTFDAESDRYKTRRELDVPKEINMNPILEAALLYASRGLHVFPVNGKIPACAHGFMDASCDESVIRSWFDTERPPGIAIATGSKFGIAVLDMDPRNGGEDSFSTLLTHGNMPDTPMVITGGGGTHTYFSIPKNVAFAGRSSILPGIDLKSDGGYVVAPPSKHLSGKNYAWEASSELGAVALSPMPEWLRLIVAKPDVRRTDDGKPVLAPPIPDVLPEGDRHKWLLSFAGSLRRRGVAESTLMVALREENRSKCRPPLEESDIAILVGDVMKRYRAVKEQKKDKSFSGDRSELTDLGNAERFSVMFGSDLRYCYAWRKWCAWDGSMWIASAQGEAERAAQSVPADILRESRDLAEKGRLAALANSHDDAEKFKRMSIGLAEWSKKSESRGRIAAILELAAPMLEIKPEAFDWDLYALNCANGTVDLKTGRLRQHSRSDFITRKINSRFIETAKCPHFDNFMFKTMNGDMSKVEFVMRGLGYSMTGDTREQVMFFMHGEGSNGKSKLLECVSEILGPYAMSTPADFLTEKHNDSHPTELADLNGKRFVTTIEVGQGKHMAEALMKQLTGGDVIRARRMREDFWEFRSVHHIWLAANHKPIIRANDYAVWRRILMVPFSVKFWNPEKGETGPEEFRIDKSIPEKLRAEHEGILAALVRGCLAWQSEGLAPTNDVLAETADYRSDMDSVGDWFGEKVVLDKYGNMFSSDAYNSFVSWCKDNGEGRAMSQRAFSLRIIQLGAVKFKSSGKRAFTGVRFKTDEDEAKQRMPGEEG